MRTKDSFIFRDMVLPQDLKDSIDSYVDYGIPTGGFLEACIDNNLSEACGRADDTNIRILPAIVAYFYNEVPTGCWGFVGAHDRWVTLKIDERKTKAAEENGDGQARTGSRVPRDAADER